MLVDGISRRALQALVIDTLKQANTPAGDSVFEPRDWPTRPELLPMLMVAVPRERKVGMFPGTLEFTTTMTLVVTGKVAASSPDVANEMLDELEGEILEALLLAPGMAQAIQQYTAIDTTASVTGEGKVQVGEVGIVLQCELYQAFGPTGDPLISLAGSISPDGGAGLALPINFKSAG